MRATLAIVIAILILGYGSGAGLAQTHAGDVPALDSIRMIDALVGWAVTAQPDANALLHTTDGGAHWRDVTPLGSSGRQIAVYPYHVAVLTSLVAWILSLEGAQIFHTVDGGQTWRIATTPAVGPFQFIDAHRGWLLSNERVAAGSEDVDIYHSSDGGSTWIKVAGTMSDKESGLPFAGDKGDITFLNATMGWITGYVLTPDWLYLYVTHDGGQTWRQQKLPVPPQVLPHWNALTVTPKFFTVQDGVLPVFYSILNESYEDIAWGFVFYVTHDGGTTWMYTTPVSATKFDSGCKCGRRGESRPSFFADVNHGWVADGDMLYVTTDGGRQWTKMKPTPPFREVRQLDFISPQVGWAVRQTLPFLLKTLDGGRIWTPVAYTISR